jgi:DNA-binding CsgD family transcriptional regulator
LIKISNDTEVSIDRMSTSPTHAGVKKPPRQLELTPRQRQILSLICKGKANKQIARDLDISLGTVKQHVAALFKRMNVHNRSMAVAQGKDLLNEPSSPLLSDDTASEIQNDADMEFGDELLLIRRPCVVLIFAVPALADTAQRESFNRHLKKLIHAVGAVHLTRGPGENVLLFGVRAPSVWDPIKTVLFLRQLRNWFAKYAAGVESSLTAALDAGLAVISIGAAGKWSGDTVATPIISVTRRLLSRQSPGTFGIGKNALQLLAAFHGGGSLSSGDGLSLWEIEQALSIDFQSYSNDLSNRPPWPALVAALDGQSGQRLQLLGPQGVGKSYLCRALVRRARAEGRSACYLQVLPDTSAAILADADTGKPVEGDALTQRVAGIARADSGLMIVDDCDLLTTAERSALALKLQSISAGASLLVMTARTQVMAFDETLLLDGYRECELDQLLSDNRPREANPLKNNLEALFAYTHGLPLFVFELANQDWSDGTPRGLTLATRLAMANELDRLPLDWSLLRAMVECLPEPSLECLRTLMTKPFAEAETCLRKAVRSGVLTASGSDGTLRFANPLTQHAVEAILV